jgi:hypothetical protein
MASTRIIEQDHGTYAGLVTHPHNGYYAGDLSRRGSVRASTAAAPRIGSAGTALRDGPPPGHTLAWRGVAGHDQPRID